jgi:hypothetical protein
MMTPWFGSNFASSAEPRMNLRVQSGLAHSRLTLDAFSNSIRLSTAGQAGYESPNSIKSRIVLSGWNCVSNSLQGHQLIETLGASNLWKQV